MGFNNRYTFHTAAFVSGHFSIGTSRGVDVLLPGLLDESQVRVHFTLKDVSKVRSTCARALRVVWFAAWYVCTGGVRSA